MSSPPPVDPDPLARLLPRPRRHERGTAPVAPGARLVVADRCRSLASDWLRAALGPRGRRLPAGEPRADAGTLEVRFEPLREPIAGDRLGAGYRLFFGDRPRIEAANEAGRFAGAATLLDLLEGADPTSALPELWIEDFPAFERRGYMLDVSRDRVPTMARLRELIEELARAKYNELQLYVEHTFAFEGHEEVWRDAGALTPLEVRELDAACRARGIALVPNMNSLGHFHRWLVHPRYRALAEVPEGVEHAFALEREPFSLCPTDPRSFALIEELHGQFLPNFSSDEFNVGLDETFDLGSGRSREAAERGGPGSVYFDWLRRVHASVREGGRRMQFWGDVILSSPERVPELPRDAIALEWGYEAGHPLERHSALFAESGLAFHVCPGTSTWQAFSGRVGNARANIEEAARAGTAQGARGLLLTDWGDYGHWQPPSLSRPAIALQAEAAWSGDEAEYGQIQARVGRRAYGPAAAARAATLAALARGADAEVAAAAGEAARVSAEAAAADRVAGDDSQASGTRAAVAFGASPVPAWLWRLGRAHERTACGTVNATPFFFLLKFLHEPLPSPRLPGLNAPGLAEAALELEAITEDAGSWAREEGAGATAAERLAAREIAWSADICRLACRIGEARLGLPEGAPANAIASVPRARLADDYRASIATFEALWRESSREGGLATSAGRLRRSLANLE